MVKRQQAPRGRQARPDSDEDAFVAGVLQAGSWARSNQPLIIAAFVLLAVVVAGGIYLRNFQNQKLQNAALELEAIQASIAAGNPDAAKADLSLYLEQFAGTPYAGEAALVLGELYLDSEQPDLALRSLNEAGIAPSDPLGPQALRLEARAHEAAGDYATAEASYLEVAETTEMTFERQAAWADAARMRELQGDWAGAATLYGQILAGLDEDDPSRGFYEMRREEARTKAG
jgi:predicted negative regulator of RcsB-dependent stress response